MTCVFGDNKSVIESSMIPNNKLNKRHNALSFCCVHKAMAAGMITFHHIDGKKNSAGMLSKHWHTLMHGTICGLCHSGKAMHWTFQTIPKQSPRTQPCKIRSMGSVKSQRRKGTGSKMHKENTKNRQK